MYSIELKITLLTADTIINIYSERTSQNHVIKVYTIKAHRL